MPHARRQQVHVVLLCLVSSVLITSCAQPLPPDRPDENRPAIELQQNRLTHYDSDGKILWELQSPSIRFFDKTQETQAEEVEIRFLSSEGAESLWVQGENLVYHHRSGNLAITGEILARDSSGIEFATEEAFWDDERKVLWSESQVRVERSDFSLTGSGFEYDPEEGTLTTKSGTLKVIIKE